MPSLPSPTVAQYTPRTPYAVGPKEPLANARRLMEKYGIRDLPVRAEGKLVGILCGADLRLLRSMAPPPELTVDQVMIREPYSVASDPPLDVVVRTMVERGIDAAVVHEEGNIVGVFTSTNAMEALVDLLEHRRTGADERFRSATSMRAARGRLRH